MNELTGTFAIASWDEESTISVSRNTDEISQYISQIRLRAGIPDYDASVYNDAAIFRTNIKRERQIELFAEGHRYFDLRRWKDAPKEEAEVVRGFNMNMERNQRDLFEIPVKIPSLPTVFVNRMYLWPLSPTELKRNNKLTQNPGWETFD